MPKQNNHYKKASAIAEHYGFLPSPEFEVEKQDIAKGKTFKEAIAREVHPFKDESCAFSGYVEEKICIVRNSIEKKLVYLPQPPMIYYEGPMKGNTHLKRTGSEKTFNLDIIGNSRSISDAMLIETCYVIVKECRHNKDVIVELNSIGDKDSIGRFARELTNYFKKHSNDLSTECRSLLKKDVFALLTTTHKSCIALRENAPPSINFLSEASRNHFKEVLEYLESLSIPYTINPLLVGNRSYCMGTIFEIKAIPKDKEDYEVVAIGERYNSLAKKVWGKKEIPAVGAAVLIPQDSSGSSKSSLAKKKVQAPRFYFIQLGFDAKLKSLGIIEMLRKAKIPVLQSLSRDKLTSQLGLAEKLNVPYVLIMGQKEAVEGSVVVRNMLNRAQDTVSVDRLVEYLKKLA
ncbi:MAG: His/Gly/Thr/Pro-type tRNA ligase C-terminal domain-containing protein [Candidatus Pacebacteria bacterium]|nr:His/Gly/Thr/Pro-type tRNA ligase C-terminal domain-containing protein [Candidatus Paceibacterota bacterium]